MLCSENKRVYEHSIEIESNRLTYAALLSVSAVGYSGRTEELKEKTQTLDIPPSDVDSLYLKFLISRGISGFLLHSSLLHKLV